MDGEQAWHEFRRRLGAFITDALGEGDGASEVEAAVLRKVAASLRSLEWDSRLDDWIYQITRNRIVDHWRMRPEVGRSGGRALAPDPGDGSEEIDRAFARGLEPMASTLPPPFRDVVGAVDYQGATIEGWANAGGNGRDGAEALLSEGRRRLRVLLLAEMVRHGFADG